MSRGDGVHGRVLGEAAQGGEEGAQLVALGHRGQRLFGARLDAGGGPLAEDARDVEVEGGGVFALHARELLRAEDGRLHRVGVHDDVGDAEQDFLLVGERHHVLLRGGAQNHQRDLLGVAREPQLVGEGPSSRQDSIEGESTRPIIALAGGAGRELPLHAFFINMPGTSMRVFDLVRALEEAVMRESR